MAYHCDGESSLIKYKYMGKEKLIELLSGLQEEVKYITCNGVNNIALLDSDKECIGAIDVGLEEIVMWKKETA